MHSEEVCVCEHGHEYGWKLGKEGLPSYTYTFTFTYTPISLSLILRLLVPG